MSKRLAVVTIFLIPSMLALAGQSENLKMGGIITKFGDYKALDGKLALKLSETNGKLRVSLSPSFAPFTTIDLDLESRKSAFWLYPETEKKLWFFRDSELHKWELTKSTMTSTVTTGMQIREVAPKVLLDALPKEVLDKIKDK